MTFEEELRKKLLDKNEIIELHNKTSLDKERVNKAFQDLIQYVYDLAMSGKVSNEQGGVFADIIEFLERMRKERLGLLK